MDWYIVLVLWIVRLVFYGFCGISQDLLFKIGQKLNDISKYQLIDHFSLQKMLESRINFFK